MGKQVNGNAKGPGQQRPDEDVPHRAAGSRFPLGQHQLGGGGIGRLAAGGLLLLLFFLRQGGIFPLRLPERLIALLLFFLQLPAGLLQLLLRFGGLLLTGDIARVTPIAPQAVIQLVRGLPSIPGIIFPAPSPVGSCGGSVDGVGVTSLGLST